MNESIQPFDCDADNIDYRWTEWLRRFDLFLSVKNITQDGQKINYLLYYGGISIDTKYQSVKSENDTYTEVVTKIATALKPPANKRISRHRLRRRKQFEYETFGEYVKSLRVLAKACQYSDEDDQ